MSRGIVCRPPCPGRSGAVQVSELRFGFFVQGSFFFSTRALALGFFETAFQASFGGGLWPVMPFWQDMQFGCRPSKARGFLRKLELGRF